MRSEVDGVTLTDEEILDICFLFIIAGLDTVTDSLDCIFGHLSQNPEHRRQVAGDESVILRPSRSSCAGRARSRPFPGCWARTSRSTAAR
jgi:cytochrome P450